MKRIKLHDRRLPNYSLAEELVNAIGAKKPWLHSAFHIFVIAGSILQFVAIYRYIL